jgi:hypothetical protein
VPVTFSGDNVFEIEVPLTEGHNVIELQGLNGIGEPVNGATDSIEIERVPACEVTSVVPSSVPNDGTAQLTIFGSGFMERSRTSVTLASNVSEEIGFDALYVQSNQAFDRIDAATLLLDDPTRGVGDETHAVHTWINFLNTGDQGEFTNDQTFAAPFNGDPSNFAVRFTGYIYAPSPGTRYFGVNSDDGFSLWIDGRLVGEYANARAPATTDVSGNRTAGTMTFNFPEAGTYFLVLDYYENGGGESIEFFQTNSVGGARRLINVNSELVVYRDNIAWIDADNVRVVDDDRILCSVNVVGAAPGMWSVIVTPECGEAAQCRLEDALEIVAAR